MSRRSDKTPIAATPEAEAFYVECLRHLKDSQVPALLGGTYAVCVHTGVNRQTKDLDVFCRAGDFPRLLGHFQRLGYETEVEDERWIAKVWKGPHFFDVIFNSTIAIVPITDQWFANAGITTLYGMEVAIMAPTELIWSKAFVQDRNRYDGADIAHLILRRHRDIDWRRLLAHMEQHWEVLLIHVLNFRFVYPTERDCVPRWLFDELMRRLHERDEVPAARVRICRGRLFSRSDYQIDISEWGFADVVGDGSKRYG